MKITKHIARRLAALALAGVMTLAAAPQALAADTIGGADTAQVPVSRELEQENCIQWLLDLFGLGGSGKITVDYLNVRGQGLRRNVRMDLVDCLVGITYTELGSIGSYAEISDRAAAEAWKAQAIAIHSYLEYQKPVWLLGQRSDLHAGGPDPFRHPPQDGKRHSGCGRSGAGL